MTRLAIWTLGLWLGLLLASWVTATVNFRTVDQVLGPGLRPEVSSKMATVPVEDRRMLFRHLASEINRWMFRRWSLVQFGLAIVTLALAWPIGGAIRATAIAIAVLVLFQAALVRPIIDLGGSIDFVPRPLPAETHQRFGVLHVAYLGSDFVKAALLLGLAWLHGRR